MTKPKEENNSLSKKKISRRELLVTMGTASGAVFIPGCGDTEAPGSSEVQKTATIADVLVIGGGTAGTVAAIQSAKAGASTVLLEKGSLLGGTMTKAGVNFPGLFYAWGRQIIGGVGWDLVKKTVELNDDTLPDFSVPYGHSHWLHQVRINGNLYPVLAEEACLEAGVEILYYELPLSVKRTNNGWKVDAAGSGIRRSITCKQIIDCTGGADIAGMAGLPRVRGEVTQPGTLMFQLGGYDMRRINEKVVKERYGEALKNGELKKGDFSGAGGSFMHFLRNGGRNAQHVFGADSSTSAAQTETNIKGRASLLRLLRFVRSLPGCGNARIDYMAQETGVRETYRIDGETQITYDDYTGGRVFGDAVSYSFYPIDVHDEKGVEPKQLKEGTVPTVPLRALIPKGSRNFLVAGRSVSSDRLANSALRVQASCMGMGQAAGAAAALAVKNNTTPGNVPMDELRAMLKEHGAIVPG